MLPAGFPGIYQTADTICGADFRMACQPGMPAYLTKQKGESYFRLNYTFPPRDRIVRGVKILCDVMRELITAHAESDPLTENEINPIL